VLWRAGVGGTRVPRTPARCRRRLRVKFPTLHPRPRTSVSQAADEAFGVTPSRIISPTSSWFCVKGPCEPMCRSKSVRIRSGLPAHCGPNPQAAAGEVPIAGITAAQLHADWLSALEAS
jgi:hypothetical protein